MKFCTSGNVPVNTLLNAAFLKKKMYGLLRPVSLPENIFFAQRDVQLLKLSEKSECSQRWTSKAVLKELRDVCKVHESSGKTHCWVFTFHMVPFFNNIAGKIFKSKM